MAGHHQQEVGRAGQDGDHLPEGEQAERECGWAEVVGEEDGRVLHELKKVLNDTRPSATPEVS